MNNPLRYAGTTFYQQSYNTDVAGKPTGTILQVVTNPSWMTPYVACMLVAIGMLAHFGTMLFRFLRRRTDDAEAALATYNPTSSMADTYRNRKKMTAVTVVSARILANDRKVVPAGHPSYFCRVHRRQCGHA